MKQAHFKRITLFDGVLYAVTALISLICIAPFLYVFSVSLTDPEVYVPFKLYLIPEKFSLETYRYVLANPSFMNSLKNTVFITVVGTCVNIAVTFTMAFALTKKKMPHRNLFMGMVVFTLLFNPGIVPNYMMVKSLGLVNSYLALILPNMTNAWSLIVAKSFLDSIPGELQESATIDGCNDIGIFFKIILPLSTAAIATLTLFFAVGHWNTYLNALIYLTDLEKRTLQVYVKSLLMDGGASGATASDLLNIPSETVRLATVVLAMLPILIVYPFLQKYFVKGVMLGSIKG